MKFEIEMLSAEEMGAVIQVAAFGNSDFKVWAESGQLKTRAFVEAPSLGDLIKWTQAVAFVMGAPITLLGKRK